MTNSVIEEQRNTAGQEDVAPEVAATAAEILRIFAEKQIAEQALIDEKISFVDRHSQTRHYYGLAADDWVEAFGPMIVNTDELSRDGIEQVVARAGGFTGLCNETTGTAGGFAKGVAAKLWAEAVARHIDYESDGHPGESHLKFDIG